MSPSATVARCIRERSNWGKLSDVHKMDHKNFNPEAIKNDIQVASPKLYALIQNIMELDRADMASHGHTFKHFIYSDIKSVYGAKLIASALVAFGFHHAYGLGVGARGKTFTLNKPQTNAFATLTTVQFFQKPLGINFRKELLKRFNARPANVYGEDLRIVILDSGLREGVDLFDVKYVHLFEPIMTTGDQKQAVGRATRFCGQKGLAFDNGWPLHVYRYDTQDLFDLFLEHSQIDMRKLALAQTLEDVVIDAAVDRTLTRAFRIPMVSTEMDGGGGYAPSMKDLQAKRVADARAAAAIAARAKFVAKREKEEREQRRRHQEYLRELLERRQAEEAERQRLQASADRRARAIAEAEAERRRKESTERRARLVAEEEAERQRRQESAERRARVIAEEETERQRRQASADRRARVIAEEEAERQRRQASAERRARLIAEEEAERRRQESADRRARLAAEEEAERQRREASAILRSRIPPYPATVEKMDAYVQRHFKDYTWPPIELKNGCDVHQASSSLDFSPTQNFIRNYLTPDSPYHGLLAFHSVGTGKTCLAIATATTHFEPQGWTILYVTKTTLKGDVWKNMFDQVCSLVLQEKLRNGIPIPADPSARMRMLSKSWSQIHPLSYRQFSNMLRGKSALSAKLHALNGKKDPLNKTLVIVDEAHKLFVSDMPPSEKCDIAAVKKALDHSYETSGADAVKLLLMTGTPYTDDPMDMVKLLNLLTHPTTKLPETFQEFAQTYLDANGNFTDTGRTRFSNQIAGYVSYLNREKDRRTFSYPIFYNITVPMVTIGYDDIQLAFDTHQRELEDMERTLQSLESGEAIKRMEAELKQCLATMTDVVKCKSTIEKQFEPLLIEKAKVCNLKDYRKVADEKNVQLAQCLRQGPDDCTPLKEQLKQTKSNQKLLIQTAKQHLKDVQAKQRALKTNLQKSKDVDISQRTAIHECLTKKLSDK